MFIHREKVIIVLVAVLMVLVSLPALAQNALPAQVVVRALTQDDIGTYKLPATTERSGGLATVALGQAVYLDALLDINVPGSQIAGVTWALTKKPANSQAALTDSPLGPNVPVYEPADRLIYQVAGRSLLRADVTGLYAVKATITTVGAGTAVVTLPITAGTYVGVNTCTMCHKGGPANTPWSMVTSWQQTAHSQIFTQGVNGVLGDHYGTSCLGCHTVGYDTDPNAVNGGFDDVAKQLGWTFPGVLKAGNWEAMPAALQNVGNIQCENCHGPGSTHVSSGGDTMTISRTLNSGACGQCHGAATHHVKTAEWNNSLHAITTRDPSGAGRESCVGCHTAAGFIGRVNGSTTVDTTYTAITCQTCHEPHGLTTPSSNTHLVRMLDSVTLKDGTVITAGGNGKLCMNCHQSRQNAAVYAATTAGSARFGPHHSPQADMLMGTNGFTYDKYIPSSAHGAVVADSCVTCHMQAVDAADPALTHVGGHTFKVSWPGDAANPPKDMVAACQGCHGPSIASINFTLMDYDDDGAIEGVQTEVQHMLDKLALLLPPVGKPKTDLVIDSTWTQAQLKAAFNYQFVRNDGSFGIHNTAYALGLLEASIADLQGKK